VPLAQGAGPAEATRRSLNDVAFPVAIQRRAYESASPMFWPNVGRQSFMLSGRLVSTSKKGQGRGDGIRPPW
jgi:hypothetical protein